MTVDEFQKGACASMSTHHRLMLDMAYATDTLAFWETACELLFSVAPFQVAAVYSKGAAILLTRTSEGRFEKLQDSAAAAQDLRVGSVYNYLHLALSSEVMHIDAKALRQAPQHGHAQLRARACEDLITVVVMISGWVCADVALYRSAHDRVAAPDSAEQLQALYPSFERMVIHHWRLMQKDALDTAVTGFLRDLPVGLAFFSWEQELLYANDEAYRQSHVWDSAPQSRAIKQGELRKVFRVVPEFESAWAALRYERALSLARLEPMERTQLTVTHPRVPHLRVMVGITVDHAHPFRTPNFVLRFIGLPMTAASDVFEPTSAQLSALAELTPAERAVAILAMRGLDNQSIAAQIHREVSTVKDHLTRIYAKLGVKSRAQLASLRGD